MTQDNFNITEYISNGTKWYSHQQMEYLWQPVKENYCTTAQYTQISETRITVRNVANHNGVNGEVVVSDEQLDALGGLCGEVHTPPGFHALLLACGQCLRSVEAFRD